MEKICSKCNILMSLDNFHRHKSGLYGHSSFCKKCASKERSERHKKYISLPKNKWKILLKNAEKRDIDVDISYKDFLGFKNKPCEYCGEKLDAIRVDRVDGNKSYKIGNIVSCCADCNFMKNSMNIMDFLCKVEKIYLHQNTRKIEDEQERVS